MKDIYDILRQKEPDREAEEHNQPTLPDLAAPEPIDLQAKTKVRNRPKPLGGAEQSAG